MNIAIGDQKSTIELAYLEETTIPQASFNAS